MAKKVVVFDFDGTLTDAEAEGESFVKGYLEDLCLLVGKNIEEVVLAVQSAEAKISSNPNNYGWLYDGLIVAPAMVDPYLRIQSIAGCVLDRFGVFLDHFDRKRLLDLLFKHNYSFVREAFKAGAGKALSDLCANSQIAVYVVTNSHTRSVGKKMALLSENYSNLDTMRERVIGGAKKYIVGDGPEHVVEKMTIPGLSRVIYLHRSAYYNILEKLREENGVGWEDMTVIGDIFELDLALPFMLGTNIGLVVNQFTPQYERDFITARPARATLINSLSEVLPFVLK